MRTSSKHGASAGDVADTSTGEAYLQHLLIDGSREGDSGAAIELPPWYNEQLFKRGQSYFNKYRFVITSGMLSGLIAVLAIPSILRVLVATHQSSTAFTAYRRYLRTIFHTQAWYFNPLDNNKSTKFWSSIKAVRRAHSRSSRISSSCGAGEITQKDLALTQFGFFGFITLGAHRIQLYDEDFLEATVHMWRVLGYLLGIKDEYNICGHNWEESKQRLDIVMRQVFAPALEKTDTDFQRMARALIDGLCHVNTNLSFNAFIFYTKRLAYVEGYAYYSFDYLEGEQPKSGQKLYYYDLGLWDRFIVTYGLFIVTYLHKYAIVRWYLNFRVWLMDQFIYYFPYVAIWHWGWKAAYVRIFHKGNQSLELNLSLKEE